MDGLFHGSIPIKNGWFGGHTPIFGNIHMLMGTTIGIWMVYLPRTLHHLYWQLYSLKYIHFPSQRQSAFWLLNSWKYPTNYFHQFPITEPISLTSVCVHIYIALYYYVSEFRYCTLCSFPTYYDMLLPIYIYTSEFMYLYKNIYIYILYSYVCIIDGQ